MQLNTLTRVNPYKKEKRVGRGGGRGKTSGRGTKGQKARAGHRIMPAIREQLKKLPKLRGRGIGGLYSIQDKPFVVNVSMLQKAFSAGDTVSPKVLMERGVIRASAHTLRGIKILGEGELTKKLTITGCTVSKSARTKVEGAGGSVAQ